MQTVKHEMSAAGVVSGVALLRGIDLEQLIRAHSRRLYNFVRRRVGNPADVDDLVQDTYVEAVKSVGKFHGYSRPETWLFGIAMNLVRNHYKRAHLHNVFEYSDVEDMHGDTAEDPMEAAERHQTMIRIVNAIGQLPRETQMIFHLIFDDNCSYEEAATTLGMPVGTIRSRISRARALLRDRVG
jgi:RNA polymerase sigma factor (sigma-70 family)